MRESEDIALSLFCREDKFLYLMKNLPIFVETPALWEEEGPYFRAMLDEAEYAQMSREQKRQYREEMRRDWDYKNTMDYAIAQGYAQGRAQDTPKVKKKVSPKAWRKVERREGLRDSLKERPKVWQRFSGPSPAGCWRKVFPWISSQNTPN